MEEVNKNQVSFETSSNVRNRLCRHVSLATYTLSLAEEDVLCSAGFHTNDQVQGHFLVEDLY